MNELSAAAVPGKTNPTGASTQRASTPEQLLAATPLRAIVQLALPTTAMMVVAVTANVAYTYFVSRLGDDAIAAISLVFPISLVAITLMGTGIGAGAASAIARALGARQPRAAQAVAEHGLALGLGLGALFGVAILGGARILFSAMGATGAVLASATTYARVLFGGALVTFSAAMLDNILRGEGNVRVPAFLSSASLLLQIVLTPLFMFVAGWGLVGAAIATLTSQLLATIPRARYVFGGRGAVHPSWRLWRPSGGFARTPLVDILRVGIPASLSGLVNYLGIIVLTAILARFGEAHLAAYGLGTRFNFLLLSLPFGFATAVLTLVGMAAGARQAERVTAYVIRAGAIVVGIMTVAAALLWWRPELWFGVFTRDAGILTVGRHYFRIIGLSFPFVGVSMVLASAFQGLGRATIPMTLAVVRVIAVLIVAVICTRWLGMADRAVFATVAAGNVMSATVLLVLFVRLRRSWR